MDGEVIIGLDFGNYYSYPCFVEGMDSDTHRGGASYPLIPSTVQRGEGIPSLFYKEKGKDPEVGFEAGRSPIKFAKAEKLLKRHMGGSFTMGGETFTYQRAATMVIQDVVRLANKELKRKRQCTTNKISLARPAAIYQNELYMLIDAVQAATLEDGTNLEVVGTVLEPAAAALAYFCDDGIGDLQNELEHQTVLVYDLGAGTFDATILTLYPKGIGVGEEKRYYDEEGTEGLIIGGQEFTNVLEDIILELVKTKYSVSLNNNETDNIRRIAEQAKRELSESRQYEFYLSVLGNYEIITREMFEDASRDLLMQTIDCTQKLYMKYIELHEQDFGGKESWRPRKIILTGGSSVMPMVKRELLRVFSMYGYDESDIISYEPSMAISIGAARYFDGSDRVSSGVMFQHTTHDLGIMYLDNDDRLNRIFIKTLIPKHSLIPCKSDFNVSILNKPNQETSRYKVYEARVSDPDPYEIDRDWKLLCELVIKHTEQDDYGNCKVRKNEARIVISELGLLRVEARELNGSLGRLEITWHSEEED